METWQFLQQDETGLWCWWHTNSHGEVSRSERCFESRTDCIVDAMKHGYLDVAALPMSPASWLEQISRRQRGNPR